MATAPLGASQVPAHPGYGRESKISGKSDGGAVCSYLLRAHYIMHDEQIHATKWTPRCLKSTQGDPIGHWSASRTLLPLPAILRPFLKIGASAWGVMFDYPTLLDGPLLESLS